MARPRVFVSSPYYDLKHIRSSLDSFIDRLGYEPVLSEKGILLLYTTRLWMSLAIARPPASRHSGRDCASWDMWRGRTLSLPMMRFVMKKLIGASHFSPEIKALTTRTIHGQASERALN